MVQHFQAICHLRPSRLIQRLAGSIPLTQPGSLALPAEAIEGAVTRFVGAPHHAAAAVAWCSGCCMSGESTGLHPVFLGGGRRIRRLCFDAKFCPGLWGRSGESPELVSLVEQWAAKGHILVLGCGAASVAGRLNPKAYATLLGVDLSTEAVARARLFESEKNHFQIGDMVEFECPKDYSMILFSDTLYYAPFYCRKWLLDRLCRNLTTNGRIIVAVAWPKRYRAMLKMIRRNFQVCLDRPLQGEKRHVIIFSAPQNAASE